MKLISARASRAPAPTSTVKRAPAIFVPRSKSMMPSAGPRSQCACGVNVNVARRADAAHLLVVLGALPHRHALVRDVRHDQQPVVPALLDQIELDAQLLDLLRALTVGFLDLRRVEPLPLGAAPLRRPTCSARASALRARAAGGVAAIRARPAPRARAVRSIAAVRRARLERPRGCLEKRIMARINHARTRRGPTALLIASRRRVLR